MLQMEFKKVISCLFFTLSLPRKLTKVLLLITISSIDVVVNSDTRFPGCNLTYPSSVTSGIIVSPNFPYNYQPNQECYYTFERQLGRTRICLYFRRFELESSNSCQYDYLHIGETSDRICGNRMKGYKSLKNLTREFPMYCFINSGAANLKFVSDMSNEKAGFFASFTITPLAAACDDNPYRRPANCLQACGMDYGPFKRDSYGCVQCKCAEVCYSSSFRCWSDQKCLQSNKVCDGSNDCSDKSDESYELAPCGRSVGNGCTFERGYCGLNRSSVFFMRKMANVINDGPTRDHTTGRNNVAGQTSYFAIVSAMSMQTYSTMSLRMQPINIAEGSHKCLTFYYHLHLVKDGQFMVKRYSSEYRGWLAIWKRTGEYGDVWNTGQIELSSGTYNLEFTFKRITHPVGTLAIDDISLLDGKCLRWDLSCEFETGDSCGWETKQWPEGPHSQYKSKWFITAGSSEFTHSDRTTDSSYGHFLLFRPSYLNAYQVASLTSPHVLINVQRPKCLSFWYLILWNKSTKMELIVKLNSGKIIHPGKSLSPYTWTRFRVEIPPFSNSYQVIIQFRISPHQTPDIIVDQVNIHDGSCDVSVCSHEYFTCLSGGCILLYKKCDGNYDCDDHSDESPSFAGCKAVITCPPKKWKCMDSKLCIDPSQRCDGKFDCSDNSDEDEIYSSCKKSLNISAIIGIVFAVVCIVILINTIIGCLCRQKKLRQARAQQQLRRAQFGEIIRSGGGANGHNYASSSDNLSASASRSPISLQPPPYSAVVNESYLPDVLSNGQVADFCAHDLPPSYEDAMAFNSAIPSYEDAVAALSVASLPQALQAQPGRPKDDSDSGVVNCEALSTDTLNTNLGESSISVNRRRDSPQRANLNCPRTTAVSGSFPILDINRTVSLHNLSLNNNLPIPFNRSMSLSALHQTQTLDESENVPNRQHRSISISNETPVIGTQSVIPEEVLPSPVNFVSSDTEVPELNGIYNVENVTEENSSLQEVCQISDQSLLHTDQETVVDDHTVGFVEEPNVPTSDTCDEPVYSHRRQLSGHISILPANGRAHDNPAFEMEDVSNAIANDSPPRVIFIQNINAYPSFDV